MFEVFPKKEGDRHVQAASMIMINNYLHRDVLSDLIERWMYHDVRPSDAELVARLVNFNHTYVSRYLRRFCESVFGGLYPAGHVFRRASVKRDLKEALVANPPFRNARIVELISNYQKHPEHYYSDTPFQGILFFTGGRSEVLIGSCRIKRVRRLAEKVAHRIIDRMFESIKARAESLADDRARQLGIPREMLVTPPGEMQAEFVNAEARLLEDLRLGRPVEARGITINDVAGIKVILENDRQEDLLRVLERLPGCRITEKEFHTGLYKATNLIVSYRPDREGILSVPVGRNVVSLMEKRGMSSERTQQAFAEFVRTGEDTVAVEIIVSSYQETLESEIGRCMHEERIVRQRATKEYRGHLAKNIEYLMEYLFAFSQSAERELPELPIKLWNRYLPDYFDDVLKRLYHIPSDSLPDEP